MSAIFFWYFAFILLVVGTRLQDASDCYNLQSNGQNIPLLDKNQGSAEPAPKSHDKEIESMCNDTILNSRFFRLRNTRKSQKESLTSGKNYLTKDSNANVPSCQNKMDDIQSYNNYRPNYIKDTTNPLKIDTATIVEVERLNTPDVNYLKEPQIDIMNSANLSKLWDDLFHILDKLYVNINKIEKEFIKRDTKVGIRATSDTLKFILQNIDRLSWLRERYVVSALQKSTNLKHAGWSFDLYTALQLIAEVGTLIQKNDHYCCKKLLMKIEIIKLDLNLLSAGCDRIKSIENMLYKHLKTSEVKDIDKTFSTKIFYASEVGFSKLFNDFYPILQIYKGLLKNKKERLLQNAALLRKKSNKMLIQCLSDLRRYNKNLTYLVWSDCLNKDVNRTDLDLEIFCKSHFFIKTLPDELINDLKKEIILCKRNIARAKHAEPDQITYKKEKTFLKKYKECLQNYRQLLNDHADFFKNVKVATVSNNYNLNCKSSESQSKVNMEPKCLLEKAEQETEIHTANAFIKLRPYSRNDNIHKQFESNVCIKISKSNQNSNQSNLIDANHSMNLEGFLNTRKKNSGFQKGSMGVIEEENEEFDADLKLNTCLKVNDKVQVTTSYIEGLPNQILSSGELKKTTGEIVSNADEFKGNIDNIVYNGRPNASLDTCVNTKAVDVPKSFNYANNNNFEDKAETDNHKKSFNTDSFNSSHELEPPSRKHERPKTQDKRDFYQQEYDMKTAKRAENKLRYNTIEHTNQISLSKINKIKNAENVVSVCQPQPEIIDKNLQTKSEPIKTLRRAKSEKTKKVNTKNQKSKDGSPTNKRHIHFQKDKSIDQDNTDVENINNIRKRKHNVTQSNKSKGNKNPNFYPKQNFDAKSGKTSAYGVCKLVMICIICILVFGVIGFLFYITICKQL